LTQEDDRVTTTEFLERFEQAYHDKLHELEVDEGSIDTDPAELGRRVALLVATRGRWERQLGLLLSSTDFQRSTGLSRQALSQAVEANRVLRLTTKAGKTRYPGFQLDESGRVLPGLRIVLGVFAGRVRSPWTTASWLTSPQPELDGGTPVEFLEAGGDPEQAAQVAGRVVTRLDE
jgi:hypothetical protein